MLRGPALAEPSTRVSDPMPRPGGQLRTSFGFCPEVRGQKQAVPALARRPPDLLVRLLGAGAAVGRPAAVVGLDGERVVLLQLAVQLLFGADEPLARGLIHHHGLKGHALPVDLKPTDLTWGGKQRRSAPLPPNRPQADTLPAPHPRKPTTTMAARGGRGSVGEAGGAVLGDRVSSGL